MAINSTNSHVTDQPTVVVPTTGDDLTVEAINDNTLKRTDDSDPYDALNPVAVDTVLGNRDFDYSGIISGITDAKPADNSHQSAVDFYLTVHTTADSVMNRVVPPSTSGLEPQEPIVPKYKFDTPQRPVRGVERLESR